MKASKAYGVHVSSLITLLAKNEGVYYNDGLQERGRKEHKAIYHWVTKYVLKKHTRK